MSVYLYLSPSLYVVSYYISVIYLYCVYFCLILFIVIFILLNDMILHYLCWCDVWCRARVGQRHRRMHGLILWILQGQSDSRRQRRQEHVFKKHVLSTNHYRVCITFSISISISITFYFYLSFSRISFLFVCIDCVLCYSLPCYSLPCYSFLT